MSFFDKFFGYFRRPDGSYSWWTDNSQGGPFAYWRHYVWLISFPIICVFAFRHYRRHPENGRKAVVTLAGIMLVLRLTLFSLPILLGYYGTYGRIIPFHLCGVMGVMLPITIFFDIKRIAPAIYPISMMGALASLFFGDYFTSSFTPFYFYEGIIAHTLLFVIPIIEIARRNFTLDVKDAWKIAVTMLLLMGWATLGNKVFFPGQNTNYMYLDKSGFPGGFGGPYYFLIYVAIFVFLLTVIYSAPIITRKLSKSSKPSVLG